MWSLGVLILHMVSYFPDEQCQKLHKNFALIMHEEQLPFIWLTVDMLQLRSRLVKSGGEELKLFLNDHLLTVNPKQRSSASSLLKTQEMKKWCLANVEADSAFLRSHFINEVDFANQMKLEADSPNYDALETVCFFFVLYIFIKENPFHHFNHLSSITLLLDLPVIYRIFISILLNGCT